jgi:hypothetical protein
MDTAVELACRLSAKRTARLGCRGFGLLRLALPIELECDAFLTCDRAQGALARAEGPDVTVSAGE